jgi:hypothetical protein
VSLKVYTHRFLLITTPATNISYTVPAGRRAVITSINAANTAGTANSAWVAVAGLWIALAALPATTGTLSLSCRIAVYAGEAITGKLTASGAALAVTGYLFDDPTTFARDPADYAVHTDEELEAMRAHVSAG